MLSDETSSQDRVGIYKPWLISMTLTHLIVLSVGDLSLFLLVCAVWWHHKLGSGVLYQYITPVTPVDLSWQEQQRRIFGMEQIKEGNDASFIAAKICFIQ